MKEGLPRLEITCIVKSVKYVLYWGFDAVENFGVAQENFMTAIGSPLKSA